MTMIMVSNNGPHSPEKWAAITIKQVVDINPNATGPEFIEGKTLEMKLLQSLVKFHKDAQDNEKGKLASKGYDRLHESLDPSQDLDVDAMVMELVSHALGTSFESHFAKPVTKDHLRGVLLSHFATSMDIERSWHADNATDKNDPKLVAYVKARQEHYKE